MPLQIDYHDGAISNFIRAAGMINDDILNDLDDLDSGSQPDHKIDELD